jgi:hypothetical protein
MMQGLDSSMIHLIFYKDFCKYNNGPLPSTIKTILRRPHLSEKQLGVVA